MDWPKENSKKYLDWGKLEKNHPGWDYKLWTNDDLKIFR